jgi:uncharacterized membrane protein YoaT (DUF817 family)
LNPRLRSTFLGTILKISLSQLEEMKWIGTCVYQRFIFRELVAFLRIQFISALFPISLFTVLGVSKIWDFGLPRYDLIFIACLIAQAAFLLTRLESLKELAELSVFHVCGLALEIYKVRNGSWTYPDDGYWRIGPVPIFSGFMYASVASYMLQAWKRLQLRTGEYPEAPWIVATCVVICFNFFLNKFWPASRLLITFLVLLVFWKSKVTFVNVEKRWQMPLNLAFFLLGLFVWMAEHICSALGAYQYPYQADGWTWVDPGKLTAWCLLVVVCFAIVASLSREAQSDDSG